MRLAIQKAREGIRRGQTPFGACLVKNGKIISCAHNRVWNTTDITAHAEIQALREACLRLRTIDLAGSVIYSTCEPCPMCFSACHWARISKIICGTRIQDARAIGFNELAIPSRKMAVSGKSPVRIVGNFMRRENLALFKTWRLRKNKRAY